MSDNNKYLIYGIGAAAAIAVLGAGVWYLSQVDEYEEAKKELAKLPQIETFYHPQFGVVMEIEPFVQLTAIIKTEQLRKRREQLESEGLTVDYPLEHRRELYREAVKSGQWEKYDEFVVKNEAAEEQITAQTVREIAAIAGYSEEVINNTTQFSAKQMSNLTKIDTAASGLAES